VSRRARTKALLSLTQPCSSLVPRQARLYVCAREGGQPLALLSAAAPPQCRISRCRLSRPATRRWLTPTNSGFLEGGYAGLMQKVAVIATLRRCQRRGGKGCLEASTEGRRRGKGRSNKICMPFSHW
jgi:hypothetical protein